MVKLILGIFGLAFCGLTLETDSSSNSHLRTNDLAKGLDNVD